VGEFGASVATEAGNAYASLWNEVAGELEPSPRFTWPDAAVIGQALRDARDRLNSLGPWLRLGANTVSRWESGRNVQTAAMDMLLRLIRDLRGASTTCAATTRPGASSLATGSPSTGSGDGRGRLRIGAGREGSGQAGHDDRGRIAHHGQRRGAQPHLRHLVRAEGGAGDEQRVLLVVDPGNLGNPGSGRRELGPASGASTRRGNGPRFSVKAESLH